MEDKVEQTSAMNENPVLSVDKNGCVLYSNEAGNLLLNEWRMEVGEKLPSSIVDLVQRVISRNRPEKMEVKVRKRVYLVIFSPLPEQECVNISGFDISDQKDLEEKLQESESRLRMAQVSAGAGIWDWDMSTDKLNWSDELFRLFGLDPRKNDANFEFWRSVLHSDDRLIAESRIEVAVNNQIALDSEYRIVLPSGEIRWINALGNTKYDSNGKPMRMSGICIDITKRKIAEEALKEAHETLEKKVKERTAELEIAYNLLKESEKSLSEAQEMAHVGNWSHNIKTGEVRWSDEVYRIFGFKPQEFGVTYNLFLSLVHPDDRDFVIRGFKQVLNGKLSDIEYRIIRSDGVERIVHEEVKVIFDKENIPVQLRGIVQDITERKNTEEKIQNLANIVESSKDAIVTVSLDCIVTSWNKGAEQIFGYTAEEILGKKVTIIEPDNLRGKIKQLVEQVKQGKKTKNYESSRLKKDGTLIIISGTLSPVLDTSGKLVAISVIARDITDRKRTEEAMANIEIARKKEIHHRIKNNLQVISSLLDLQAEKFRDKRSVEDSEVLKAFRESQDRVTSIALIHEELHEGKGTDTLNFSHYIQELADNLLLTYRLGNEGIILDMDIEEDIFFDMDTSVPLGIIINELISNSLKHAFFGRDKGEIQIKLHREVSKGTSYFLSISDNGIGIPEDLDIEDLDSLGLQLVTTLVDQLDGKLELKRNNGTEFTIKFSVTEKNNLEFEKPII
jgi:PAS domain S-box-containing protein